MSHSINFSCPACNETRSRVVIPEENGRPPLIECCSCRAEMFWPLPSNEELAKFYAIGHGLTEKGKISADAYLADTDKFRDTYLQGVHNLKKLGLRDGGVYVDIGCSYGYATIELRRLGYDAWGVDFSQEGMSWLNEHGGRGYCGSVLDEEFPLKSIDYAYSSHALEHMSDPYRVISRLRELMPTGAILHLTLPHWGGFVAKALKERWAWFGYPTHLHYFDYRSLPSILTLLGFEPIVVETSSGSFDVGGVLNAIGMNPESVDDSAKGIVARMLAEARMGENLHIVARRI